MEELTEEELAAVTAVLLMMDEGGPTDLASLKVREVWPKPSPWRWAPMAQYR